MSAVFDVKKARREELHLPPARPTIVDVTEMTFVMMDGAGRPTDGYRPPSKGAAMARLRRTHDAGRRHPGVASRAAPWLAAFACDERGKSLHLALRRSPSTPVNLKR